MLKNKKRGIVDDYYLEDHPYYKHTDDLMFVPEDLLCCLELDPVSEAELTVGKFYEVLKCSPEYIEVQLIDDAGKKIWVDAECFVLDEDM